MTIRSCLEKFASETPDAVALRSFGSDKTWHERTWKAFLDGVRSTADAYGPKFGLKPREENVALILGNGPVWMEAYLAQSGCGVSVVPLDPKLHNAEVQYILKDSGAVVVTTDKAHLEMMRQIAADLPDLRAVVIVDGGQPSYDAIGQVPVYDYENLRDHDGTWFARNVAREDDVASVIYTSGTTGKPKGAMLTHGNFMADVEGALGAFGERVDSSDSLLIILPLFHAFSFLANFVLGLYRGMTMSFVRSLYTVGEDVKLVQPTLVMAVPLLAEKVYDKIDAKLKASKAAKFLIAAGLKSIVYKNVKKGLGGKLRFMIVGGAPCPKHVLEGYKKLGITLLEGYGLTECSPVVSVAGPKCAKIGTIGLKLSNIEVRLADKNEQGIGELQVKGPITMKGYWHNDEATAEAYDDGWLKTGDLASIDAETGLISIRGRKKALIVNREGKNIYPEEVENRIAGDPLVADCVVVGYTTGGIPGEKVGCVVHPDEDVLKELEGGQPMAWEAVEKLVQAHVHARCSELADYKRVRKVVVVKEPLERTSIQKVRRVAYKGTLDE
ncbi:MAG: AMP-binding protein [Kiritimatiellae bacterium]|nr:AMP-binding protein [Kiritimatiellia bacterium]